MNKQGKFIVVSLGITIVGAAIWDFLLRDFCIFLFKNVATLFNYVFSSFIDNLYSEISTGFTESTSLYIFAFTCAFLLAAYLFMLLHSFFDLKKNREKINYFYNNKYIVGLLVLFVWSTVMWLYTKEIYINQGKTYSRSSLLIVKPYVSDSEFDALVSKYYISNSRNDFLRFYNEIETIKEQNNLVKEFKFKPI